jgi:hypothetical protein
MMAHAIWASVLIATPSTLRTVFPLIRDLAYNGQGSAKNVLDLAAVVAETQKNVTVL